jgi:hypothetical protein
MLEQHQGDLINKVIELSIAAHRCRAAARTDKKALSGLNRCAERYTQQASHLLEQLLKQM